MGENSGNDTPDFNMRKYFSWMGYSRETVEQISYNQIPECNYNSDYYNMKHKKRGVALIFNQENFENNLKQRFGTKLDGMALCKVFTNFEFDVRYYVDLKYGKISEVLKNVSKENHIDNDCLVVCVMSHGDENGRIYSRDHTFPPEFLWSHFSGDACQTLAGKPKLFFIQACRGEKVDDGVKIKQTTVGITENDSGSSNDFFYTIPVMADLLVMYSTYPGYFSWRSPENGSWFIQALCSELGSSHFCPDLMKLLTIVNRRVALSHESYTPDKMALNRKKQICMIVSTLIRLVSFYPKSVNDFTEKEFEMEEKEEENENFEVNK